MLTWGKDGDGCEESMFLLHHLQFTNTLIEDEHRGDELFWYACGGKSKASQVLLFHCKLAVYVVSLLI